MEEYHTHDGTFELHRLYHARLCSVTDCAITSASAAPATSSGALPERRLGRTGGGADVPSTSERISVEVRDVLLDVKQMRPRGDPATCCPYLAARRRALPAAMSLPARLTTTGLRLRAPRLSVAAPSRVWTADFKGSFGSETASVSAHRGRMRLSARLYGPSFGKADRGRIVFEQLFRAGLPTAIRTDSRAPFATPAL